MFRSMSTDATDPNDSRPKYRGDDVRLKLLDAAIEVFGRHGFDGATTRMLSGTAGVNLQAIPYYFGGKEGLYLAVADHIAERLQVLIGPVAARIAGRLAAQQSPGGEAVTPAEARLLLTELLETAARVLVHQESASWSRFIIREQMEPTEAFERIYQKIMSRLLETARSLVGIILGEAPTSAAVRLRTVTLLGQVLVFRVANAAVMRQLGWTEIGPEQFIAIRDTLRQSIAAIAPAPEGGSSS
jgi:TetR/AcrR family transcriptional regulator, regulator of cefoperazone and chloramphenicol sensitivity